LTVRGEARDTAVAGGIKEQLQRETAKGYTQRDIIEVRSDAMIWAEEEARKKVAAQQKAEEEAKRLQAEAEAKRRADEEAKRQQPEPKREVAAVDDKKRAEASNCQNVISSIAREGIIQFQRASFDLDPKSLPTLDKLAKAAGSCPSARIEIEGHTDAEGTPERNARLSQRRAESVASYLARSGVGAERVKAVGYGETRPVAPNDTAANRAKNRRIEFQVIAQ
jgi:outer membrane protein OmpA-like peptidoglycan-associated protein